MKSRLDVTILVLIIFACLGAGTSQIFFATATGEIPTEPGVSRVGFDIDNTLVFSDMAFDEVRKTTDLEAYTDEWWEAVNRFSNERLCPPKKLATAILREYQRRHVTIYAITARKSFGGETLKQYVSSKFGIPEDHIFFEPESKTDRLKELKLDVFYGDSDTDIKFSMEAGVKGIRVLRHPYSTYWKHYEPGKYGEIVLQNSAE